MKSKSIIVCLVLMLVLGACSFLEKDWSAEQIAEKMMKDNSLISGINANMIDVPEQRPYGQESKIYLDIDGFTRNKDDSFDICIEIYENNNDAIAREYALLNTRKWAKNYFDKLGYKTKLLPAIYLGDFLISEKVTVSGNAILRINNGIDLETSEDIEEIFKKVISMYTQTEKNTYDEALLEEKKLAYENSIYSSIDNSRDVVDNNIRDSLDYFYQLMEGDFLYSDLNMLYVEIEPLLAIDTLNEKATIVVNRINEKKAIIDESRNQNVETVNTKINDSITNLNVELYDEATVLVDELTSGSDAVYYEQYRSEWQKTLSDAESVIEEKRKEKELEEFKKSCQSVGYEEFFRNSKSYYDMPLYFKGKVMQVVDQTTSSATLLVNVTQVYGSYWTDKIYVTYSSDGDITKILEDDIIDIYALGRTDFTYNSVMGANITVPSVKAKLINVR